MVVFVGHNDTVIGVTAHARRPVQLSGWLPLRAEIVKEFSFRGENFNPTVWAIGNLYTYIYNVIVIEFRTGLTKNIMPK